MLSSGPADAETIFTVNKTGDAGDRKISDTKCDTSRKRGKQCTLRAAIQESNDTLGADTINFAIGGTAPVKTINVGSTGLGALPAITEAVTIDGYTQPGASANTLATGNDGCVELGNTFDGVLISSAPNNTIGGTVSGARNVISGNGRRGVQISGSGATGNKVEGNYIGTDAAGTADLGNTFSGVFINGAHNTIIGGTASGARNIISGNGGGGVAIEGPLATGNKVEGNYIGTNASGTADLGNAGDGVRIFASNNTVGGTASGSNIISGNNDDGVDISSGTGNSILFNEISQNSELGIDLSPNGVTNNDTDDPDTGANNLQNFPDITSAIRSSSTGITTISGTLNSNPGQTYTIQCFETDGAPDAGHGEGKRLLSTTTTTTDNQGDSLTFTCTDTGLALGDTVTATATNTSGTATGTAIGDTSEFAENEVVRCNDSIFCL